MGELSRLNESRRRNLQKAIEVRQRRAELKRLVKDGEIDAITLIRGDTEHEELIAGWRLEQLVPIVPGIGTVTANEIYAVGPFSPAQKVRSLNRSRRERLAQLCQEGMR